MGTRLTRPDGYPPNPIRIFKKKEKAIVCSEFFWDSSKKLLKSEIFGDFAGLFRCQPSQPCRQRTSLVRSIRSMVVAVLRWWWQCSDPSDRKISAAWHKHYPPSLSLATTAKPPLDHRVMGSEISSQSPRTAT